MRILLSSILALGVFVSQAVSAQGNLVVNGDFETGDFSGWTAVDSGSGSFLVYQAGFTPASGATPPVPRGSFASLTDQSGPGTHILYQDVTIPMEGMFRFSIQVWFDNQAGTWVSPDSLDFAGGPNQQVRIDIMDPAAPVDDTGSGVLKTVLRTRPGNRTTLTQFREVVADLTEFAGQTVRIRIAEVDNQFFLNLAVDNVAIVRIIPVPADNPVALMMLVLTTLLAGGLALRRQIV